MKAEYKIDIPTEWSEVSIEKYVNYIKATNDLDDEDDKIIKTISVLCDIPEDIITKIKMKDLTAIQKGLQKLISKPVNKEIINKINIDKKVFGLHPKLDEITMGEFVDIEMYANENDLAGMMSVLYRPITETQGNRYNIEPYDADIHMDNKKLFEKLSVNVANPIAVFFWNLGSEQMQTIHQYSEKEMQDNQ